MDFCYDPLFDLDLSIQVEREAIAILSPEKVSAEKINQLRKLYDAQGFVFFRISSENVAPSTLSSLALSLGLGGAFVPPYLKKFDNGLYDATGVNIIGGGVSTQRDEYGAHNAFQTTEEQKIHCDGTVQLIGSIKTSIVLCKYAASSGGESTFFNSIGFFKYLLQEHSKMAEALLNENSLKRAVVTDLDKPYIGPAFKVIDGCLVSRLSMDKTTDWAYGIAKLPELEAVYLLLKQHMNPSSRFFYQTQLSPGEGVIMANTRISHGRACFVNGNPPREMLRGLYLNRL